MKKINASYCFLFLALFLFSLLPGEEALSFFSFRDLPREQNAFAPQKIRIRGFLYDLPDGRKILSEEPALKTCCLGSSEKIFKQIFILPPFSSNNSLRAVALEGTLFIRPLKNAKQEWIQWYVLENASFLIEEKTDLFFLFIGGAIFLLLGGIFWIKRNDAFSL